jgi:hypothetical protein
LCALGSFVEDQLDIAAWLPPPSLMTHWSCKYVCVCMYIYVYSNFSCCWFVVIFHYSLIKYNKLFQFSCICYKLLCVLKYLLWRNVHGLVKIMCTLWLLVGIEIDL